MNEFLKTELETNENGEFVVKGTYDIASELVHEITERKESLWKHFCKDVCEKMVSYYYEDSINVIHFHKVFNEKFNETIKEWDNSQEESK